MFDIFAEPMIKLLLLIPQNYPLKTKTMLKSLKLLMKYTMIL